MNPIFIGELNPYGGHPHYALYDEPSTSAGGRLRRKVLAVHSETYLACTRYNLCDGKLNMAAARSRAHEILVRHSGSERPHDPLVLLGRKVVNAFFGGPDGEDPLPEPFTLRSCRYSVYGGSTTEREPPNVLILPHPSGLCREWHAAGAFERARAMMREFCPDFPVGEAL